MPDQTAESYLVLYPGETISANTSDTHAILAKISNQNR